MKRPAVLLCAALCALLPGRAAALDEHPSEDKPAEETVRAANLIIGQMTNYLADVAAMKSMTDAEKIAYIKDKASERVTEHVIAADVKVVNEAMEAVLTKSVQYYTYTEVAKPLLEGAAKTGVQVNRALLDSRVAALVDTRISAVKSLYSAAELTGTAVGTMAKEGPMAGVKVIGGAIAEKLGEYFIPGYSWIKLGADFTQALLDYVIAYANEAAKEGIVETLFNAKSEPEKFLKWLVKSSEGQVSAEVDEEWENFNIEAGHFTFSKTPKGAADMKAAIKSEFLAIRRKALDDMKAQEESTKLIRWALEDKLRERTIAEEKAREAAQKVQNDKLRILIKIDEFKNIHLGMGNAKGKADDIAKESKKFTYTVTDAAGKAHTVTDSDNVFAVFHPMSLTLESLKPAIEDFTLKKDQDEMSPAYEALEKQITADWEKQYKAYQDDYDAVPWRVEGTKGTHYYADMLRYRDLTKAQHDDLRQSLSKYHGFLRAKSQETYGRIMSDISKVSAGLDQRVIQNSLTDVLRGLPSQPEVEVPLRARLTRDMLPAPDYAAVQHGTWFGPLWGALREHAGALENEKRRLDDTIAQLDLNIEWADKAAETKIQVEQIASARAAIAREAYDSSAILMQMHLKDLEKQGLLDAEAWAKPIIAHLNALIAANAKLHQIRANWASVSEDLGAQLAAEKKMMARLENAGAVLGELYRLHPREQVTRWTVDCSEAVPGYVYSAGEGAMECPAMAADPKRYLNTESLAKTKAASSPGSGPPASNPST
ncbi:MAG: hypothetical protein HY928_07050 [Elusimicrobia bacterium]|nr:hypothetical protein [Elusimicrobiota bacterium]